MIVDDRIGSRIEEMVYDYNNGIQYTGPAISRVEKQIQARINGDVYAGPVMSRIERWIVYEAPIDILISRIEEQLEYGDEYQGDRLYRLEFLLSDFSPDPEYRYNPLQANTGLYLETDEGSVLFAKVKKGRT